MEEVTYTARDLEQFSVRYLHRLSPARLANLVVRGYSGDVAIERVSYSDTPMPHTWRQIWTR